MACTLDRPCGGLLKRVLVLPDATIYQCTGSSHTHRVGAPPPPYSSVGAFHHPTKPITGRIVAATKRRRCAECGKWLEAGRAATTRYHVACRGNREREYWRRRKRRLDQIRKTLRNSGKVR